MLSQRKRGSAREVYCSVACVRASAPLPSPHIRLRRCITTLLLLLLSSHVVVFPFSIPPSPPPLPSPPPPPPSLTPPPAEFVVTHHSFPPLSPSLRLCLLLRGPPHLLSSSPRPGRASFHLQPSIALPLACLANNDLSVATHPLATHKHTQPHTHQTHPRTTHQNILGPAPSPSHNSTSSLRPSSRRFHNQNHTQSTPAFPPRSLPSSILHTSSDLHEPR